MLVSTLSLKREALTLEKLKAKRRTDSLANQKVANLPSASARSRHFLIRYAGIQYSAALGELVCLHVPDAENPSDFLTKFVPNSKLKASTAYVLGFP